MDKLEYTAPFVACMVANLAFITIQTYAKNAMTPSHIVSPAKQQSPAKTVC